MLATARPSCKFMGMGMDAEAERTMQQWRRQITIRARKEMWMKEKGIDIHPTHGACGGPLYTTFQPWLQL